MINKHLKKLRTTRLKSGKTIVWCKCCKAKVGSLLIQLIENKHQNFFLEIKKMSSEAVGQALKKNAICIIIPYHRVIGKSSLGGYNGGIKNKLALLNIEGERNE